MPELLVKYIFTSEALSVQVGKLLVILRNDDVTIGRDDFAPGSCAWQNASPQ